MTGSCGIVGSSVGDDPIEHLLLDSRRLIFPATSLFFALRGPRRDGTAYYGRAVPAGGEEFCGDGQRWTPGDMPEANIIRVADTLAALQRLAAFHRRAIFDPGDRHHGQQRQDHRKRMVE